MSVKQAVFLVGGKGTRLGPLTHDTPKPMLEVAPGIRFLDVLLDRAASFGFTDIILLAGHFGEQLKAAYQGKDVRQATVTVLQEPAPLGTAGALKFAADRLDEWFLLSNGDSYFEIDLRHLAAQGDEKMDGRIALRSVPDPARYGSVSLSGDVITGFHEKDESLVGPALINGGIYLLRRDAILDLVKGPSSIERDVFPQLAAQGQLRGEQYEGYFLDIGLPETYAQAGREIITRWRLSQG
jgi:NDP-sugar pyrophosphorylase family protein